MPVAVPTSRWAESRCRRLRTNPTGSVVHAIVPLLSLPYRICQRKLRLTPPTVMRRRSDKTAARPTPADRRVPALWQEDEVNARGLTQHIKRKH